MPKGIARDLVNTAALLAHIHSLGVASRDDIGGTVADDLVRRGLIEKVWIGIYALTEAGEQARPKSGYPGQ
jgi:hypothetical protein